MIITGLLLLTYGYFNKEILLAVTLLPAVIAVYLKYHWKTKLVFNEQALSGNGWYLGGVILFFGYYSSYS